jgi:hypothetical protein
VRACEFGEVCAGVDPCLEFLALRFGGNEDVSGGGLAAGHGVLRECGGMRREDDVGDGR